MGKKDPNETMVGHLKNVVRYNRRTRKEKDVYHCLLQAYVYSYAKRWLSKSLFP